MKEGLGPARWPKAPTGSVGLLTEPKEQLGCHTARPERTETLCSVQVRTLAHGSDLTGSTATDQFWRDGDKRFPADERLRPSETVAVLGRGTEALKHRSPCAGRQRSGTGGPSRRQNRGPTMTEGTSDAVLRATIHSRACSQQSSHLNRETLATMLHDVFRDLEPNV